MSSIFIGKNYINGVWETEEETYQKINPSTEESLGDFPQSSPETVYRAYASARKAFGAWKRTSRIERAEYFNKIAQIIDVRKDDLARTISLETGKNLNESLAEVIEALHMAQYAFGSGKTPVGEAIASELHEKDSYILRKPKGVIAIVSPFNFPVAIGAFWCAAPALVEGNTVVLKPSEDAPMSSQLCAEIFEEAGIPEGVFNVLHGDGRTGSALVGENVDHICFTGSADVGMLVRLQAAQSWNKTTSCEMGSKSAVLVFEDADLEMAVDACVASSFKLAGQRCVSASRLIVHRNIVEKFSDMFVDKVSALKVGGPFEKSEANPEFGCPSDAYYGPLINGQGFNKVSFYNEMVEKDDDAKKLLLGKRLGEKGYFMSPTVYETEWRKVEYLKKEVFGPHVAIIPFDKNEEAIGIYNDTEYGLAVGVMTNDYRLARICRDECDAGMIYWNGGSIAAESHMAFGGVKKSGNGFPSAARTFRAVTHEVSWTVNHADTLSFPQGMK